MEECRIGRVQDWKSSGLEECRIGRVQDWKSVGLEGCRIGMCDIMGYIGSIIFGIFDGRFCYFVKVVAGSIILVISVSIFKILVSLYKQTSLIS